MKAPVDYPTPVKSPFSVCLAAAMIGEKGADWGSLVERLNSVGAFNGIPAVKFVLTHIIDSGLAFTIENPDTTPQQLVVEVDRFVANTGLKRVLVEGVVEALTAALRRADLTVAVAHDLDIVTEPQAGYGSGRLAPQTEDFDMLPQSKKVELLNKIVSVDRQMEAYRGVTLQVPMVADAKALLSGGLTEVTITGTLRRTSPLGSAQLRYGVYNSLGAVVAEGIGATLTASAAATLPFGFRFRCVPSHVSRILLVVE